MNKENTQKTEVLPIEIVERRIFIIRGQKVMVDEDLAGLYQIPVKVLIQAVKRNISRFPGDFMFQLSREEYENLRSQIVTSSLKYGGRRYLPYAFTEHGVAMLSAILKSERAVQMSIFIVRAFVKLRELLATNMELAKKIDEIEKKQNEQGEELSEVYSVVKQLIDPPSKPKEHLGFRTKE